MEKNVKKSQTLGHKIKARYIVDIVLWLAVAIPTLFLFLQGRPYEDGFFCDDRRLSYPYKPDTISTTELILAGCLTAIAVIIFTEVLNYLDKKCRRPCQPVDEITYCIKSCGVFLVGFVILELVVEVVKNQMGILRPNFFAVCKPKFNQTLCPGYISDYTCTGNDYGENTLRQSRQSFPSGHSAFSMYIATFFCIYIQARLQIKFSRILKIFLQSGLIFSSLLCGIGRVTDNKHHPSDVIAGFILGITVAVFVCKTAGRNIFNLSCENDNDLSTKSLTESRDCCCYSDQTSEAEPQTPSPLLPNEYIQRLNSGLDTLTPSLKPVPSKNTQQLSIQVKPIRHLEDF
ncbi:phospholipid phosphatase 2-like isoform X2 [Ruditapes philippinarum]|uniref:phospholipid phosphatase 2-like isoform X2 n=1 Tax=Ruditapes philippinarum TaxID=129788 RepID=UPI00295B95F6|nr:phospholipid phosphatase 2-like isoform X2 [Ruditapes philippinarum]